ncbi:MAG TPA: hypothetical protein DEF88_15765 [Porphyromonadaceae bacterium]|nr:hypothetical protein [Porphyromonadaceae bacterium]
MIRSLKIFTIKQKTPPKLYRWSSLYVNIILPYPIGLRLIDIHIQQHIIETVFLFVPAIGKKYLFIII